MSDAALSVIALAIFGIFLCGMFEFPRRLFRPKDFDGCREWSSSVVGHSLCCIRPLDHEGPHSAEVFWDEEHPVTVNSPTYP